MCKIGVSTALAAVCMCSLVGRAEGQDIKLVHGAGTQSSSWIGATRTQWQGAFPGASIAYPEIYNSGGNLAFQAASYLVPQVAVNQTVLVGFSKGGIISREASKTRSPRGIVTMASPNQGLPLANNLGWVIGGLNTMTWQLADVLLLANLIAWNQPLPTWQLLALQAALYSGASYAQNAMSDALLTYLANAEPYLTDFQVGGSGFIAGLPTGGTHRYSISIEQTVGAAASAPWSAIPGWSESQALSTQAIAFLAGYNAWNYAQDLYYEIDWSLLEGWLAYFYLGSAQSLATTIMETPYVACVAVSTAGPTGACLANDGLVPSWSAAYPQAVNTTVTGPTHTNVQNHTSINNLAISRAQTILGS